MNWMRHGLWLGCLLVCVAHAGPQGAWYNDRHLRAELDHAIVRFFGDFQDDTVPLHAPAVGAGLPLVERFKRVFDGVPDTYEALPDGGGLYAGCRPHDCGVAAAVVTGRGSQIIAAAVIHYRCGGRVLPASRPASQGEPARAGSCDDPAYPTVTLFHRGARDHAAQAVLEHWARQRLAHAVTAVRGIRIRHVSVDALGR